MSTPVQSLNRKYTKSELNKAVDRALIIQALRMAYEVFRMGGMGKQTFVLTYVGKVTPRIKRIAKEQGINLKEALS